MRKRIDISEAELRRLHDKEKLSQEKIAQALGRSSSTVLRRMHEYGIEPRTKAEAALLAHGHAHLRHDFDGDPKEKAYLIGFCKGDARVSLLHKDGQTISVEGHSSQPKQTELFVKLFSPYGYVYIGEPSKGGSVKVIAYLNLTFSFLLDLEDNIPFGILADNNTFFAFLAGYIDAEGHIGVYNGRAMFGLRSYDKNILMQLHSALLTVGIECPRPRIAVPKGYTDKLGRSLRQDYWCLELGAKASLLLLFKRIAPYLKHAKRVRDMQAAIKNIKERNVK